METSTPRVTVSEFEVLRAWRPHVDLVHVHWPELAVESPSRMRATLKTLVVLADVLVQRVRGARVVWTCHNLRSHGGHHPLLERLLRVVLHRVLDGVLHLSHASVDQALALYPRLRRVEHAVVPHGHYGPLYPDPPDRDRARARLGLPEDGPVLAFVGSLRPHKDVVGLVGAFRQVEDPRARLVVAGAADDAGMAGRVTASAAADERVTARIAWLDEDELVAVVRASDVVVLPYREFHNSGVVVLAVTLGRPVVVSRSPVMEELAASVGEDWIHMVDRAVDAGMVEEALDIARRTPPEGPDLSALEWSRIAQDTIAFYTRVLVGADDPRGSRG